MTLTYPNIRLLIGGRWIERDGEPIINPSTGSAIGTTPHATRQDLDEVIAAAEAGFKAWRQITPDERANILHAAANLLRARADEIGAAISIEQGKPFKFARLEVLRGCDTLDWDAQEGRRVYGRIIPSASGLVVSAVRHPIGPVFAASPWNFPFGSAMRKLAGALAAGCSIVLKASEETPAGAQYIVQALKECGVPDGAVNLIYGIPEHISNHLISSPAIRMVSFTGSVPVGRKLASLAGQYVKPCTMELGGHAPVIICSDVDIDEVAKACVTTKSLNSGQICTSPTRFYAHHSIYDKLVDRMQAVARTIRVGDALDPATDMGPVANPRRAETLERLVEDALRKGAWRVSSEDCPGGAGYFKPLTILADVPDGADAMHQEPFGPLVLVRPFTELDEALQMANSLPYGLAGYAFTNSSAMANHIADEMNCGTLAINHLVASTPETPFGGVSDSGFGREGGIEGVQAFTVVKNISHRQRS